MLRIRLARVGKKKQPTYRVVIADARSPRDGRYVEIVGHYNPRTEPDTFVIDEEKVRGWLAKGAQPTERMHKLLARQGILEPLTFPPPKSKASAAPPAAGGSAPAATAVAEPEAPAEEAAEVPAAETEAAEGEEKAEA